MGKILKVKEWLEREKKGLAFQNKIKKTQKELREGIVKKWEESGLLDGLREVNFIHNVFGQK